MPNVNKVILIGHLTRDPELRYSQSGTAFCKFGIAVSRTYKVGDEKRESTCFVDCTAFGRTGEVVDQYVKKGDPLFVEGRLDLQQWDDKQTGQKRSKLEVAVENVQFLGSGGSKKSGKPKEKEPEPVGGRAERYGSDVDRGRAVPDDELDSLPF